MRYGLLGEKLGHSFSKEIHEALGRYQYELIEVPPGELEAFLRKKDFSGLNVTLPYKQAVIPFLDGLSPRARAIGAVNTLVNRGGKLWGDNTDFGGLEALLRKMGLDLRGKTVLILGTGGTSRTARAVAEHLGAGRVRRVSRSGREDALSYEAAYRDWAGAEALINTTPCGMFPDTEGLPADLSRFPKLEGVADVIYNPLTTRLVSEARRRGIPAENGLYMLVAQAVLAAEQFTGEPFPEGTVESVYRRLLGEKRNMVLIGMPGSGKTTLGRLLAEKTGRALADSDGEIARRAGMPITDIFRERGEGYFRDLETEVLRDLSRTGGRIIATGGGAVLRRENLEALKRNGALLFLDRPLPDLVPTADRPLGDSAEKLRALFETRYPIYAAAADLTVPVTGTPEDTAERIMEAWKL